MSLCLILRKSELILGTISMKSYFVLIEVADRVRSSACPETKCALHVNLNDTLQLESPPYFQLE